MGKPCKESTKKLLRAYNTGKIVSEKIKEKLRNHIACHKIDQYDINGNFIKTHRSIREASRVIGIDNKTIRRSLSGDYKLAGGFIWKRHGEKISKNELKNRTNHSNKKRKVVQMDLNGKILAKYESVQEAARKNKFNARKICSCCQGKFNKYKEFIWQYLK